MVNGGNFFGDPGIYWHLKTGEWISLHGTLPQFDPFLAKISPTPWTVDQWLSDIILYQLYQLGGFPLLTLFSASILLFTYVFLAMKHTQTLTPSLLASFLAVIFLLFTSLVQWFCRPVIFSFLMLSLIYLILRRTFVTGRAQRALWSLPPIFMLWANLHPAFPLGLLTFSIFALHYCLEHNQRQSWLKMGLLGAAIFAATLINPYGFQLYTHIHRLVSDSYFTSLNDEWLSPNFQHFCFQLFLASVASLLLMGWNKQARPLPRPELILTIIFSYLSFKHARYIPFYAIIAAPVMAALLHDLLTRENNLALIKNVANIRLWSGLNHVFLASIILLALLYFIPQDKWISSAHKYENSSYPAAALKHLQDEHLDQAVIFSHPNWGGYITWSLWPRAKAVIDDRNILNTEDDYRFFFTLYQTKAKMKQQWAKTRFDYVLVDPDAPLATFLRDNPMWSLVFEDDKSVLFKAIK